MQALLLVAEHDGPTMLARIGLMRALNRNVEREFNPDRKGAPWGKRKLKRDRWFIGGRTRSLLPKRELKAQSICDFFNSPLISNQIARRCNYCGLPPVSMILANLDFYVFHTQRRNDQVG
jgi:hypothetical protein